LSCGLVAPAGPQRGANGDAVAPRLRDAPHRSVRQHHPYLWRPGLHERCLRGLDPNRVGSDPRITQMDRDGMVRAAGVFKEDRTEGRVHRVLNDISFTLSKGEKLAVLGRNGAGKSTLIRLLGRVELPTGGVIERDMSLSWPIGLTGGFQGSLTG